MNDAQASLSAKIISTRAQAWISCAVLIPDSRPRVDAAAIRRYGLMRHLLAILLCATSALRDLVVTGEGPRLVDGHHAGDFDKLRPVVIFTRR